MGSRARKLIGTVLLAPFSASFVLLIYVLGYSVVRSRYDSLFSDWLYLSLFGVALAFLATLIVGLPTHFALCRLNRNKPIYYVLVGVFVALLPFGWLYFVDGASNVSLSDLLGYPLIAIGCAAAVAWTFAKFVSRGLPRSGA